ncbi:hypothetical protein C8Q80DRAFT_1222737 [Daedaleopsis nitida]|nr:hypothetical protein C8Q80DRAFT_1222737 [Daedaleopsis nitida]
MTSQDINHPEIIDLTEPDVIELDSDGEVVGDDLVALVDGSEVQSKKKRRKRKKKHSAPISVVQTDALDGYAAVSQSPTSLPGVGDNAKPNGASGCTGGNVEKKSLADRLTEPRREETERRGEKRAKEWRRGQERDAERERDRYGDRERDHGGERRGERERRRSRSPRHDRDREREHEAAQGRRRSRSRERKRDRNRRKRDRSPQEEVPLFFEDAQPAEIPAALKPESAAGPSNSNPQPTTTNSDPEPSTAAGLLLPTHVSVAEGAEASDESPLHVPSPEGSDDDGDYIDYLDYDDDRRAPGMVRYWELEKLEAEEARASKPSRSICKKCGAEGEHKTYECPVLVCLTCGARDEHLTRSCPISKVCFTCGMKGHINKTCPNRGKNGAYYSSHDCDRCGARTHQTNECPTLWRIYRYVEDEVRQEILRDREGKRLLEFGQGGEGYIATDEWCYNCGECGHLGDDCTALPHHNDFPSEHSAFSLYNILSGPFSSEASRPSKRPPRDWETASAFTDGFGSTLPMEVGRQGRRKERERQARALEKMEDDQDDWFGAARSSGGERGKDKRPPGRGGNGGLKADGSGGGGKHIKFNFSSMDGDRDAKRQRLDHVDLPGPSRETDSFQIRGAARKQSYSSASSRDRRDRYSDRDRDRDRESQRGPRYRGGYR